MVEGFPRLLIFFTVVGSALMAGVFFAFSTFVMKALRRLPSPQGIAAMQSINVAVINPTRGSSQHTSHEPQYELKLSSKRGVAAP